ncbi:MAG: Gfo/Idh/MocA family oxidoreductase [Planctomycetota bacterium]|nr:Gfo/Idh/MocA family oxidoreductase [Planctomycetota bacterium]
MTTRRRFLKLTATTAAFTILPRHVLGLGEAPPSEKLNIAGVGIGGQGGGVLNDLADQNIVALCDIDWQKAAGTFNKFPKAEKFKDYRVLLDKAAKSFDAVMVATPDHMHAPISLAALRAGKHVYVEKPMAHSIEEARLMTKVAKDTGLVTQMGNNGHAGEGLRQIREWITADAIGAVKEIHCWSDRPGVTGAKQWWPQPAKPLTETVPVPPHIDWNLFIGAAPTRPYNPNIHPFAWRGYFDFGTGALGDMAVHNMDPAFYALDLEAPIAADAQTSPLGPDSYPAWQILTYHFAAKPNRPALKITWYDGGKLPQTPPDVENEFKISDNGIMFVGDKGTMVCGGWSGAPRLFPASRRRDFQLPPKSIPRSPGHRQEWVQACKDRKPQDAKAGFYYSGPFTEALLVGNLASRLQKRIEWDAANIKAANAPEADALIRKTYRPGFGISA